MLAESRTGSVKQALVQYAQAALDEYRTRGFPDSVAVLEAYFAGDPDRDDLVAMGRPRHPSPDLLPAVARLHRPGQAQRSKRPEGHRL